MLKSQLAFCLNKEADFEKTLNEKDTQIDYLQKQLIDLQTCESPKERSVLKTQTHSLFKKNDKIFLYLERIESKWSLKKS